MSQSDASVFFWRPHELHGFMGQWYQSPFISTDMDGKQTTYANAEQYMMHQKGLLFDPDGETTTMIMSSTNPRDIKALGQAISNFDEEIWNQKKYKIVVEGNYLKFTQNDDLRAQLLGTGDKELVEASPLDRIWGIGFRWKDAEKKRKKWGQNLLGKALMEVRERIRKEMAQYELGNKS